MQKAADAMSKPAKQKSQSLEEILIPKSLTMGVPHAGGGPITNQPIKRGKVVAMGGKSKKPKPEREHIKTTFVGVDPALRKGGFWLCIICRVDNTATFKSCAHLGEFVRILQDCEPAAVKVENSNLQKNIFRRMSHTGKGGALAVGKNMGISQAATDIADQYSEIPSGISPEKKGAKVKSHPLFHSICKSNDLTLCGYKGDIDDAQDQRDALMLALIAEQQYKLHLKAK